MATARSKTATFRYGIVTICDSVGFEFSDIDSAFGDRFAVVSEEFHKILEIVCELVFDSTLAKKCFQQFLHCLLDVKSEMPVRNAC
jgi:hypothetical protein